MSILGKARQLETLIARTFDVAAQRVAQPRPPEPLEIVHAILDVVEDEVQPAGRGGYVFPFNRLKISILAPSREARARYEAVFDEAPTLHDRILERLRAGGCHVADLSAKLTYVTEAAADWSNPQFQIEFARGSQVAPLAPAPGSVPESSQVSRDARCSWGWVLR